MNTDTFFQRQLARWDMARGNYEALQQVRLKELCICGIPYRVQFNPARIVSSGAKVDQQSISRRPCFLCQTHRPAEQESIGFLSHYDILLNPFPIFPRHLTIVERAHTPQRIASRFADMLELARLLNDFTVFYNGPRCGASAPDHAHFQAGSRGLMPIEEYGRRLPQTLLGQQGEAALFRLDDGPRSTLLIRSTVPSDAQELFYTVYDALPRPDDDPSEEPMLNILALYDAGEWTVFLFPRQRHRPACYTAAGEDNLLCSPASVDLGGTFILPRETDFNRITADDIRQILSEVCLSPAGFAQLCHTLTLQLSDRL